MKKYSELYTDTLDPILFTILSRTLRELKIRYDGNKKMVERCINSRKIHPDETFFENVYFWPMDVMRIQSFPIRVLFQSRIINARLLSKKPIPYYDRFISLFVETINKLNNTRELYENFIKKYGLEINKAIIHINDTYKRHVLTLKCNEEFDKISFII